MVIGVLCTLVVALTLTPALLAVLGRPRRLAALGARSSEHSRFGARSVRLAAFDLRNKRAVFAFWGVVTLGSVLVATQLVVGNDGMRFLPERAPRSGSTSTP